MKKDCLLPDVLDISSALNVAAESKQWLQDHRSLVILASNVERVDAAGLQVLVSLFLSAERDSVEIRLDKPSATLKQGANALGLQHLLKLSSDVGDGSHD